MDLVHQGLVFVGYAAATIAAVFGVVALLARSDNAVMAAGNGVKALFLALGIALMSSILHRLL